MPEVEDQTGTTFPLECSAVSLPAEIITEIFTWTISGSQTVNILDTTSTPWNLGQVCVRWRDISLTSSPSLWNTITCASPFSATSKDILGQVLSRSGTHPLRISITHFKTPQRPGAPVDPQIAYLSAILKDLRCECHRWQLLQLDVSCSPVLNSVLYHSLQPLDNLPRLEEVYFPDPSLSARPAEPRILDEFLRAAPKLKKADYRQRAILRELVPQLSVSLHLTHFAGTILHNADLRSLLCFPALVECHLLGWTGSSSGSEAAALPPVTHSSLLRLCVQTVSTLLGLTLPNLTSLSFFARSASPTQDADILTAFMARSQCTLVVLSVALPALIVALAPCFRTSHLNSVKRLCISLIPGDAVVLQSLAFLAADVVPQLEVLSVAVYNVSRARAPDHDHRPVDEKAYIKALIKLLHFRYTSAGLNNVAKMRLLRVCMGKDDMVDEWRREGLSELEERGLEVENNKVYGTDTNWTGPFWFLEDDIPEPE